MVQPKARLIRSLKLTSSQCRHTHNRSGPHSASIAHLLDHGPDDASKVVVNGFIRSIRNQKQVSFVSVGDGTTAKSLQAVLRPEQAQRSGP